MPPPPSSLHSCSGQHTPSSAGCKAKDSPPAPKTLCGTPGIMLALPQTPLRKVAWDNVEPFSHYSPPPEPRGKPADFLGCSIREEQGQATQEGQQGLNNQPLAAPSSRTPAGTGAWYTTAPAVPHAANETAALHPPEDLQQSSSCLPATRELRWHHPEEPLPPRKGPSARRAGFGAPPLRPRIPTPTAPRWGEPGADPRRHLHCTVQWSKGVSF